MRRVLLFMKKLTKDKLFLSLTLLLFAVAVFLRVYRFGEVPTGINQDGAMAAVDAKALEGYGTDRLGMRYPVHLTAWGFGQMSALLSYLMIPFIKIFGLTVTAIRLPSLLTSLGGLVFLFLLSKDGLGRSRALAVLLVCALCPWHIMQSRWALDCNLFPHFLMAGMFFLLKGTEKKRNLYISMVFFGLSMYCYGVALYTVPVFLVAACIYLLCRKLIRFRDALLCMLVYLLVSWPFFVCMLINYLGFESIETPLFTIPYFPGSVRSKDILFFCDEPLKQLGKNFDALWSILKQEYNGLPWNEVAGYGTLYKLSIPFLLLGVGSMAWNFKKNTASALLWLMFLTGVLNGLLTSNVNINRTNLIFYPMLAFTGEGLYLPCRWLWKKRAVLGGVLAGLLAALYLIYAGMFAGEYFTSYADKISEYFMADFMEAVTAVKDADTNRFYITPDAQYESYAHVSEALTLFYHDVDAHFYQSAQFRDKYRFENPDRFLEDEAVYVTTEKYLPLFERAGFTLTQYGRFYTAQKKYF